MCRTGRPAGRVGREDVMVTAGEVTLVLGGARSGKSAVAERLAATEARPVTYVATGPGDAGTDDEWRARLSAHRRRRPPAWSTVEVVQGGDLGAVLLAVDGTALVDSLGTWVAGHHAFAAPGDRLLDALGRRASAGQPTVVVSEEVGLGVHPSSEAGGRFRDVLGRLNQEVAVVAGTVLLVVAGRVLRLEAP
ncbi:MAG: bifunctional adenosylcobinamide kinase/adenosylcobinamide-phosphate guanylyltransferase [Acidimicrobiales bacterium]